MIWDGDLSANDFVRVRGQATLYQGKNANPGAGRDARRRIKSRGEDFLPKSAFEPDAMLEELQSILRAIKNPHLLALAEAFFCRRGADESFETGARRKNDPSSLFRRFARAYALAAQADPQKSSRTIAASTSISC